MALVVSEAVAEVANNVDLSTYTTGSFTPTANSLLVAFAWATGTVINGGISGGSLTWTQQLSNIGTAVGVIYTAQVGASPASMTVSFDCTGDAATGAHVVVFQVTGHNSTTPVPQVAVTNSGLAATTPTVVFGSALTTSNAYLAMLVNGTNPVGTTDPSGFTNIAATGFNTPATGATAAWKVSGESGTTLTWGSSPSAWRTFGIEIALGVLTAADTETGAATDTVTAANTTSSALTETGGATDTQTAANTTAASVTEAGAATDTITAANTTAAAITEIGLATDTITATVTVGGVTHVADLTETGSATDTVTALVTFAAAVSEAGSATDTATAANTTAAFIAETGAANDNTNATISTPGGATPLFKFVRRGGRRLRARRAA